MTNYLLAGGGTAGHVNPLLAIADAITERDPDAHVLVLGTKEGLEARLVPARGYELLTIDKLPFPRRINGSAFRFPARFSTAVKSVVEMIGTHKIDVVIGFGGYASAPAYLAARRAGVPLVLHEANAKPGLANRLGARYTKFVGVAFHGTRLRNSRFVGMPLRREIERLDRDTARREARDVFDLADDRPTLLVTGGSLGARKVNRTIYDSRDMIIDAGFQILHITGDKSDLTDPGTRHYRMAPYCDRMDLALAVADFAVSRAGAATVSELSALGIPAAYVPYPVGNGEQRYNAADAVNAGGAVIVLDAKFTPEWISSSLIPLMTDRMRVQDMAVQSRLMGTLEGSSRMLTLIDEALGSSSA
jgi:UDP-N-acetylglucosamine--N-acetylmuramyl-(pentapeptide) pyrophosphoryl-undecaprenol N-acetylglucosamine transferase